MRLLVSVYVAVVEVVALVVGEVVAVKLGVVVVSDVVGLVVTLVVSVYVGVVMRQSLNSPSLHAVTILLRTSISESHSFEFKFTSTVSNAQEKCPENPMNRSIAKFKAELAFEQTF